MAEQKAIIAEYENKFSNRETVTACAKVKQILLDQIAQLSETKALQHERMMSYVKDEVEMRKIALQVKELKAKLAMYE